MSEPVEVLGEEHELFRAFVEACRPILAAGFEHAAKADPERHAHLMQAIAEERAVSRMVVEWDRLYVVVTVEAAGRDAETGEEVRLPVYAYRLHREPPPHAH